MYMVSLKSPSQMSENDNHFMLYIFEYFLTYSSFILKIYMLFCQVLSVLCPFNFNSPYTISNIRTTDQLTV